MAKQDLKFQPWTLVDVLNVHRRLTRDFPITPYRNWCDWVHRSKLPHLDKIEFLLQWDLNPSEYTNPTLFWYDYQLFKLLGKYRETDTLSSSQIGVAYDAFNSAEEKCAQVNQYFFQHGKMPVNDTYLYRARKTVERVLGDPSHFFEYMDSLDVAREVRNTGFTGPCGTRFFGYTYPSSPTTRFGPGASVGKFGNLHSIGEKVELGSTTKQHLGVAGWWQRGSRHASLHIVRGDVLMFVPKKRKTARAVLPGPSMNMRSQLAVGDFIKDRLKAVLNINLRDQTRNRVMARLGSLCDSYCTVDLSGASDSNSYAIVLDLVPPAWVDIFDTLRSHEFYDGFSKEWREYSKISAMGNGFTFELETLLFYALVEAAIFVANDFTPIHRDEIAVYGDDMIFPKEYYCHVTQLLVGCGHTVNLEKSYSQGPFRESCGGDYFNGWLVTPYKLEVINEITDAINFHNGLFEAAVRFSPDGCPDPRFSSALDFISRRLQRDCESISYGQPERLWNPGSLEWEYQSSGRFLWSDNPWSARNTFYSLSYQTIQPKYLLLSVGSPRGTYDKTQKRWISVQYETTTLVAAYLASYGGEPPSLVKKEIRVVRNPCDNSVSRRDRAFIRGRVSTVAC